MSRKKWLSIFLLGFAGQVAWAVENQFFNTFMYDRIIPDPLYVSIMVASSAVVATITSIFMGAFSDKLGRRKPFLFFGYLIWGISIIVIPGAGMIKPALLAAWVLILLDCLMTFFGSTAYDAAYNAYMTDITTRKTRGRAQGLLAVGTALAILLTYGLSGVVIDNFGYYHFFGGVGLLVFVLGLWGGALVDDRDTPVSTMFPGRGTVWERIVGTFRRDFIREQKSLFRVLLAMALWGMSFNVFFPFLLIYMNHYLKLNLTHSTLLLFLAIFIGGVALSFPAGMLIDRVGRKKVALVAVILQSAALFSFALTRNLIFLAAVGIVAFGAGNVWSIATGAWSKDLFPEEKRGEFAGYMTLFNVAFTMVPGPIIGGILSRMFGIKTIIEGQVAYIPTPIIIIVASFLMLLAILPLFKLEESDPADPAGPGNVVAPGSNGEF
ncbi:MAG: MFS transporter [Firmicutes bacterium]|mgnify:CR=1 FL=1|jgi:MFS family permease|nr:MFS transporter [Bacillota bacterium]